MLWNLQEGLRRRSEVLRDSLGELEFAEALGFSVTQVREAVRRDELVALTTADGPRFPIWQISPLTSELLVPVSRIIKDFPAGVVELSVWMNKPHPDLDGATPAEILHKGDSTNVLALMHALSPSEW